MSGIIATRKPACASATLIERPRAHQMPTRREHVIPLSVLTYDASFQPMRHECKQANDTLPPRRARVLLVDDNVDTVNTLAELLRVTGYDVRVAYDGIAGLQLFFTFGPDVAILDLGLTRIDGFRIAEAVREDAMYSSTRLIALSAYDASHHRERSRRAGFDHHLSKPVSLERLHELLREYDPASVL